MKKKTSTIYFLLSLSVGYLLYNSFFTDYRYSMMSHHYGYFDTTPGFTYFLNAGLVIIAYVVIIFGLLVLIKHKNKGNYNAFTILDQRLSSGDISVEEYQKIKNLISK